MLTSSTNASLSISTLSESQVIENAVSNTNSVDSPISAPELTSSGPAAFTRSQLHKRQAPPPPPSFIPSNGTSPSNSLNQPSRTVTASLSQSSEFPQARTIEQLLAHIPNVTFVAAPDEFANSKLEKSTHTWVPTSGHLVFDEESRQPICEFLVDSVYYGKAYVYVIWVYFLFLVYVDLFFILDLFMYFYSSIFPVLSISKFSLYWFYFFIVDLIFKCISVLFLLLLSGRDAIASAFGSSNSTNSNCSKIAKHSKLCTGNG